ncbi:MAG: T9SS type A sorting domain-containing protein [Bacteroidales bacterium]
MRKISIITLLLFVLISSTVMAQIPNPGFETWSGNEPVGWDNMNSITILPTYNTCLQGTPGNPGNSYLKLVTKTVPIAGVVPGIALSGKIDKTTFQPKSGFAYNQRPTALTGNWQYMAGSLTDQGFIAIAFTKWNTINNKRDTISTNYCPLTGMVMSWESFNIPIVFSTSAIPDTCLIILSSSALSGAVANSYLYVDNLNFSFVNTVKENKSKISNFNIYPNPVTNLLQFDIPEITSSKLTYKILNSLGQTVLSSDVLLGTSIETKGLLPGFYQLIIENKEMQYVTKFIKK